MILTFHKTGIQRGQGKSNGFDLADSISGILSSLNSNVVYGEYLFNRVVMDAWNKGAISSLSVTKDHFTRIIEALGWHYDARHHYWSKGAARQGAKQDALFGVA